MGKEITLFTSEERIDVQMAAAFLRQLADKIASRQVVLRQGSQELFLDLPEYLVIELKAEEELKGSGKKRSLEIELEWVEGEGVKNLLSLG